MRRFDTLRGLQCAAAGWMRSGRKVEELGNVTEEGRLRNELDGGFDAFWSFRARHMPVRFFSEW